MIRLSLAKRTLYLPYLVLLSVSVLSFFSALSALSVL
jgi:hypothetical protein